MTAALEFTSVSKTYQKRRQKVLALNEISFHVNEGEVFGFVGPNGAGKSTTIKTALDIIRDYTGEVKLFGINAKEAESRKGVSFVPESPALYEQFTPLETMKTSLQMHGIQRNDEEQWCSHWLERFSLGKFVKRRVRELSKGNAQRLALARAMVSEPKLLILDEPLSGLDPVGRKDVIDILEEYKHEGGAIFFTSHVLHDVERIADRFGFINDGELLTTRSPQDIMKEHADHFSIRYHNAKGTMAEGKALREGEFEIEVSQTEMPDWVSRLNAEGGRILSIKPAVSLETVFFRILEEREQVKAKL